MPFDGGPVEQVVRTQQVMVLGSDRSLPGFEGVALWRVLAPVTERGEIIGLLEFLLPEQPSAGTLREIRTLAHMLAFVVIANGRHTDLYEWGQRTRPLSLSAEIQHRLLPGPQACEAGAFTLAGWLEPAAGIAGDTFDFSLARDLLHLSITDAMGHGVAAALNATLCVGSLRNARSEGASLLGQVTRTNVALVEHAVNTGLEDFVTGLIGRLDLRTGSLEMVNAGHVSPYLARGADVVALELPVDLPLGLFPDAAYRSSTQSCNLVTGSSWSRTACSSGTPPISTCRRRSRTPAHSTRARRSARWPTGPWTPLVVTSRTTPPSCASTGTAGTALIATSTKERKGPAPAVHDLTSRPRARRRTGAC